MERKAQNRPQKRHSLKNENLPEFSSLAECKQALYENDAFSIQSEDDPRIHIVDLFLRNVMDDLKTNHQELLDEVAGGSPLRLLSWVLSDLNSQEPGEHWMPVAFLALLQVRVDDDLALIRQLGEGGDCKIAAAQELRKRGLLR